MNTKNTKELFEEIGVVALKADKGLIPEAVKVKLIELGNPKEAIPFYAIYGPGLPEPITLQGVILFGQVVSAIEKAKADFTRTEVAENDPNAAIREANDPTSQSEIATR